MKENRTMERKFWVVASWFISSICAVAIVIAVTVWFLSLANFWTGNAHAKEFVTLDGITTGSLLLKIEEGSEEHLQALLLSSEYEVDISGIVARITLTQRFINPSDYWLEGVYAFPIQHTSAIDGLRMRIGDRFIEGVIKEKVEAQRVFDAAKKEGKKAALLVQHRPNIFTNTVANIGPGEFVVVQITYQQIIEQDQEQYTLRLPLVVAPRYESEPVVNMTNAEDGWREVKTDPVGQLTNSSIRDPRADEPGEVHNRVDIEVHLNAGFHLGEIGSHSHKVNISREDDRNVLIQLSGNVSADRDFVLEWTKKGSAHTQTSLFKETLKDETYYLVMLTPPVVKEVPKVPPRNIIFVQDVSGSMAGASIEQARSGLKLALQRLTSKDKFNILFFNSELEFLHQGLVPATVANINYAVQAVHHMRASGGTEMLPAVKAALRLAGRHNGKHLTQVVFLTDGAISDELSMLRAIHSELGSSRLFTVGIGSAPNDYFMTAAAKMGRGSSILIDDIGMVHKQMARLFIKLETPVLTALDIELPEGSGELTPNPLPDLYAGEALIAAFIIDEGSAGNAHISGRLNGKHVALSLDLETAIERPGIAKIWARRQIENLEGLRYSSISDSEDEIGLDASILEIALRHDLVSSRTSLVAVDVTPARSLTQGLHTQKISTNLPKGWDPMAWFLPRDLSDHFQGPTLSVEAEKRLQQIGHTEFAKLPDTSLNWLLTVYAGLFVLCVSIILLVWKVLEERIVRWRVAS